MDRAGTAGSATPTGSATPIGSATFAAPDGGLDAAGGSGAVRPPGKPDSPHQLDPAGLMAALEAERRRADQAGQMAATLSRLGAAGDLRSALALLGRDAIGILGGDQGAIRVYDAHFDGEASAAVAFWVDSDGDLEPADYPETLPGTVAGDLRAGGPARIIHDLWDLDPDLTNEERQEKRRGMRSSIAVPITYNDERIGSLHIDHREVGRFTPHDLAVAETLAAMAGAAIQRVRLEERVRRLIRSEARRAEAEAAQRMLIVLGEISNALASSLDYETTLQTAAGALVPELADHCAVDVVEPSGEIRRLITVSDRGELQAIAAALAQRYPPRPGHPVLRVVQSGQAEVYEVLPDAILAGFAEDETHLALLRRLAPRSTLIVPLAARGRTLGALTVAMAESGRSYSRRDLHFFEELARRCAIAVDNALLYREAQEQARVHVELVAALRKAAAERDRALAATEEALSLRDKFLGLASHELRTPIASLRGYAQLLLRQFTRQRAVSPEQVQRALRLIDLQSEKLSRLALQLLDTTRIESGRLVLERQETNVATLVRDVVESQRQVLEINAPVLQVEHTIRVQTDEPVVTHVDRTRLEQVLVNLLDNAIKYSPNGGVIDVEVRVDDETIGIAVQDRGIGVPPAHRDRIFERFYQVQKRDNPSGMGLGLYVSRQIVELHGGTLVAEFPERGGSRFMIRLPLRPEQARDDDI